MEVSPEAIDYLQKKYIDGLVDIMRSLTNDLVFLTLILVVHTTINHQGVHYLVRVARQYFCYYFM